MAEVVKYKTVSITVYPVKRTGFDDYWQFKRQDGSQVTRSTLVKARTAAKVYAQTVYKGALDFDLLTPDQVRAMKRMIEADPTCRLVDEFLVWHGRRAPKKRLGEALDEFIAAKEANRGRSAQNVKTLKTRLSILDAVRGKNLNDITLQDISIRSTLAPKTRKNIRGSLVTFFLWCVEQGYLPHGEKTVAEKLDKPITRRKIPDTYEPGEMEILLQNISPKFLPWLVVSGFAGFRTDESFPLNTGEKSPLDWADFHWDRGIIIVRPETDKNGHRRVVPILPVLRHWLYPIRKKSGPLITASPSSGKYSETKRVGEFIGGWKPNALRHSYISYRAAKVGLAKTAMECGNSESEAKKSYNDAKSESDADIWFSIGLSPKMEKNPVNSR
jgi:integrase